MKLALALLVVAACGSPRGPAWPAAHRADDDGGQSLAPRAGARAIAATESASDDEDDEAVAPAAAPSAAPEPAGAVANPFAAPAEEPITTEEIVIEVED